MALPPGLLLDGASGFVLIAFGVLALLVRPRRAAIVAFGVFAILWGVRAAVANLTELPRDLNLLHTGTMYWGSAFSLAYAGWSFVPASARTRGAIALGASAGALYLAAHLATELARGYDALAIFASVEAVVGAFLFVLTLLASAAARATDATERGGAALLALALVAWPALQLGIATGQLTAVPAEATPGVLLRLAGPAIVALAWARVAASAGPLGLAVALLLPGLALAGQVFQALHGDADDSGILGAARTLMVASLAFAITRTGLLGGSVAVRRGALTTGAVAIVLIVAQSAQSFVAPQLGLLTRAGGGRSASRPRPRAAPVRPTGRP